MATKCKILFSLVLLVFASSCYKDSVIIDTTDIVSKTYPKIEVTGEVVGFVHDEFGNEILSFTNILQNEVYNSSQSPYYHFKVVEANKNGTPLMIISDFGEFQYLIKPIGDDVNYFSHSVITNPLKIEGNSNTNLTRNLNDNLKISIEKNTYYLGNSIYTGNVEINAFIPDLQDPNQFEVIPGGHLAVDADSNIVWLDYFNVVYLDIKSDKEERLNIEKEKAKLSFVDMDCEDCLIWKYNEYNHNWEVHSNMENTNDIEFTQSGFYTIAKPYVFNLVEGSLLVEDKPVINQAVNILFEGRLIERVYTTNKGKWFAHLPINESYNYKVKIECNEIHEERFSVEEKNKTIAPFVFDKKDIPLIKLKGEVRDCSNKEINKSFFKVWQDHFSKCYFFDNSNIDFEIPICSSKEIRIQTADEHWEDIGPEINYKSLLKDINLKKLYSCNQIEQDGYFNIKIDGKEKLFSLTDSKIVDGRTSIIVYDYENMNTEFGFFFSGQEAREYQDDEINIFFNDLVIDGVKYELNCRNSKEGCGFKSFTITDFGENKNEWIQGAFKGDFWVKSFNPLKAQYKSIEGEFLVRRNFK